MYRTCCFSEWGDRDRRGAGAAIIIWVVSLIVWIVSYLLIMHLASALMTISGVMERVPSRDLREMEKMNAFFIIPAISGDSLMNIFQTLKLLTLRNMFHKRDKWTRKKLEQHRNKALRELRGYACANSPYYQKVHHGLFDSPLQELPVLTKSELMKHWDELVTDRSVKLADVQNFMVNLQEPKMFRNKYYVASTGGSSGLKGIFIYNQEEWMQVLLSYSRANDWAGLKVGLTKRLKLAVVSTTVPWHQSSLVGATLKGRLVPTLAQEQVAGRLDISPKVVFCAAEVLTNDARELMNDAWGAQPFNVYASTETAGIASECTKHNLHMYEDLVIIEVVDKDNKPVKPGEYGFKLLATVLFSRTLPLIRYEISDSVLLSSRECTCGLPFALMEDIQGRAEEIVYLTGQSGSSVPIQPNFFHRILERTPVGGWQVVQEPNNSIKILVIKPDNSFEEVNLIKNMVDELEKLGVNEPSVKVEHVESFNRTAIGKTYLIKALR